MTNIDEELLEDLYHWVDGIPLSRPKKDIKRDFSDGVLVAELIKLNLPNLVDLHNYQGAEGTDKKLSNWDLLNRKVFKKLGFEIGPDVMKNIVNCKPWAIEQFLMLLRRKIDRYVFENQRAKEKQLDRDHRPEADRSFPSKESMTKKGRRVDSTPPKYAPPSVVQSSSVNRLHQGHGPSYNGRVQAANASMGPPSQSQHSHHEDRYRGMGGGTVPKLVVEEKEQEILAKEETISILEAKVRRLNHLLHLKDIRIDDLQSQVEELKSKRPTAHR